MKIDLLNRTVKTSAREFAEFKIGPSDSGGASFNLWRAKVGQQWHQELRNEIETQSTCSNINFEYQLSGNYIHENWRYEIQGRIDQIETLDDNIILKEIKTVSKALPCENEILSRQYPAYFAQLAVYMQLANLSNDLKDKSILGSLVFVNINDGVKQEIEIDDLWHKLFSNQLNKIHSFIEEKNNSHLRLKKLKHKPVFKKLRTGQEISINKLNAISCDKEFIFFEAPTGYGKTGIVLDYALKRLSENIFDRCIYLTSKSTGQLQITEQLKSIIGDDTSIQYFQMRNKSEHNIASLLHTCDDVGGCRTNIEEKWNDAGIAPSLLYKEGTIQLEDIKTKGINSGVCPYEISRAALPFAEIWIGDYNYLFSHRSRNIFLEQPGFDLKQTLVIIDEAHNFPSRVANNYSFNFSYNDAISVYDELVLANTDALFLQVWSHWINTLDSIKESKEFDLNFEYEVLAIIEPIVNLLLKTHLNAELFTPAAMDKLWEIIEIKNFLENPLIDKLIWSAKKQKIHFTCINASLEIGDQLKQLAQTIFMSATLSPMHYYKSSCGLTSEISIETIQAEADWRQGAFNVAIDTRINTRFSERKKYYETTAETINQASIYSNTPVVTFFPSYRYAESVKAYIEAISPFTRVALQPRIKNLQEQNNFIESSLISANVLLLVLGSGYSESINILGGKTNLVIVVGPALPEVNAIQDAKMKNLNSDAFKQVYQIPGMIKVNQALGRIVRAPGQKASILLHCKRFAEKSYRELLSSEYQNYCSIKNNQELADWLKDVPG